MAEIARRKIARVLRPCGFGRVVPCVGNGHPGQRDGAGAIGQVLLLQPAAVQARGLDMQQGVGEACQFGVSGNLALCIGTRSKPEGFAEGGKCARHLVIQGLDRQACAQSRRPMRIAGRFAQLRRQHAQHGGRICGVAREQADGIE